MHQQWLQIVGPLLDGLGFSLISLEWYRGYLEMRNKVTLVARNLERSEKIRLKNELKAAIGSVGVAEVGPLYNDDKALAEMADHVFEMNRVDLFRQKRVWLFFAGVGAFLFGMLLQLAGAWPRCCAAFEIVPQSLG